MNKPHAGTRLDRLDLNLIRVFDVVYRERNLTRAAATLFLSQSAVSHALGRLRAQLGDPLFERQGRGVMPTPLARQLAPVVREALATLQHALQLGRRFQPEQDLRQLTLAMPDELEPLLLPPLLHHLHSVAPQATIASVRLDRAALMRDLAAGRLDFAIDVAPLADAELRQQTLFRDQFCVVAARGRRRADLKTYLAARHIAVSSRRTGLALEDFLLSRQGLQRTIALRCQHYDAACRIVAESDLLLTMPRRQAESLRASRDVRLLPPPVELPAVESQLYWHQKSADDPANVWLRGQLRELADRMSHAKVK